MMRCSFAVASLLVFGWLNSGTPAQADTCSDLWSSRNEVYKALGYCFTTRRAIRAFGNAGCEYDNIEDVPLNPEQRRMVSALLREERALGCPR